MIGDVYRIWVVLKKVKLFNVFGSSFSRILLCTHNNVITLSQRMGKDLNPLLHGVHPVCLAPPISVQ
jgi:hypothetical protein